MKSNFCVIWTLVVFLSLELSGQVLWADDPEPAQPAAADVENEKDAASPDADNIRDLIEQLNDDRFAARQEATRKLAEMGSDVVGPLAKAAQGPHLEVTTRAFSILEKLLKSSDGEVQKAAREALQELAESDEATVANRATKLLESIDQRKRQIGQNNPFGRAIPFGGNQQIQIQVQAVAGLGGIRKVKVKQVNGVKDIEVQDGGKQIKIHEGAGGDIKMEVTEKNKEGKEETKKYEAKNAAELKKAHPQAHKLYEKYNQGGGIQVLGGGQIIQGRQRIQIGPNGLQIVPLEKKPAEKEGEKADEKKDDSEAE